MRNMTDLSFRNELGPIGEKLIKWVILCFCNNSLDDNDILLITAKGLTKIS